MFEKEAEEYREKGKSEGYYLVSQEMEQEELDYIIDESFKDGAELGYNKAKVEVEIEQWHILAENPKDVPAENSVVKVLTEDNIIQESTYFYDDYFEEMAFSNVGLVKVLAWKEIVPPKEI